VLSKLSWEASAAQLRLKAARKISVDIMGRVKDPVHMKKKQMLPETNLGDAARTKK
jgi:hypothetical protein